MFHDPDQQRFQIKAKKRRKNNCKIGVQRVAYRVARGESNEKQYIINDELNDAFHFN